MTLVDNWKEHVETIKRLGLKIREDNSERIVKVRATTDCREIGPVDLIVIMVKCFHTQETIENARAIIGDKTWHSLASLLVMSLLTRTITGSSSFQGR